MPAAGGAVDTVGEIVGKGVEVGGGTVEVDIWAGAGLVGEGVGVDSQVGAGRSKGNVLSEGKGAGGVDILSGGRAVSGIVGAV